MLKGILVILWIVGLMLALGFISMAIVNVRHNLAKNRRIAREYKDQKQWERFSSKETR